MPVKAKKTESQKLKIIEAKATKLMEKALAKAEKEIKKEIAKAMKSAERKAKLVDKEAKKAEKPKKPRKVANNATFTTTDIEFEKDSAFGIMKNLIDDMFNIPLEEKSAHIFNKHYNNTPYNYLRRYYIDMSGVENYATQDSFTIPEFETVINKYKINIKPFITYIHKNIYEMPYNIRENIRRKRTDITQ